MLDFPSSPADGQIYGGYVYSSATGAWVQSGNPIGGLTFLQRQVLIAASAGVITLHADTKAFQVEVQGGGGGGGNSAATSANLGSAGGGAGSGGYCSKWIARPSGTYNPACSIGAAAAGGAAGNGAQFVDGTNTLTAGGGAAGGTGVAASNIYISGGLGGAATGGDINVPGQPGEGSDVVCLGTGFNVKVRSGRGGSSRFGSGGYSVGGTTTTANSSAGAPGTGYGGGGSGATSQNAGGVPAGGTGAAACVIVTEFR